MKKTFITVLFIASTVCLASDQPYQVNVDHVPSIFGLNDWAQAQIYNKYAPQLPPIEQDKPIQLSSFIIPHVTNAALINVKPLDVLASSAIGFDRARKVEQAYNEYKQTKHSYTNAQQKSANLIEKINHSSSSIEKKSFVEQLIQQKQIIHEAQPKLTTKSFLNNALTSSRTPTSLIAKAVICAAHTDGIKDVGEMVTYGKKRFDEMEHQKLRQPENFCTIQ